jgi:hypothetical protein
MAAAVAAQVVAAAVEAAAVEVMLIQVILGFLETTELLVATAVKVAEQVQRVASAAVLVLLAVVVVEEVL